MKLRGTLGQHPEIQGPKAQLFRERKIVHIHADAVAGRIRLHNQLSYCFVAFGIPTWQLRECNLIVGKSSKNTAFSREVRLVPIREPDDHQRNYAADKRRHECADRPVPEAEPGATRNRGVSATNEQIHLRIIYAQQT